MFCHISVIKDDCCVVAYGCFFYVSGGANRCFAGIFNISFSPSTNYSILMLNFTELMAAEDYLNSIPPKCNSVKCNLIPLVSVR